MSWRRWKLGCVVAIFLSLIVAGMGLCAGITWQAFVVILCGALLTHFGAFIKDHPVEQITFDDPSVMNKDFDWAALQRLRQHPGPPEGGTPNPEPAKAGVPNEIPK